MTPLLRLTKNILQKKIPGQLVIQITDQCNAECPQCGMRVSMHYPRKTLPMDDMKRMIDVAAQRGVSVVSFTGGEPLIHLKRLVALISYAGEAGIEYIRTGTNGFFFMHPERPGFRSRIKDLADVLAGTPLRNFWISVDSLDPEIHEKMRGFPGIIKGIEQALPIFHEREIYPSANLGINRNMNGAPLTDFRDGLSKMDRKAEDLFFSAYKNAFRKFYRFVIDLGFTMVNSCYPMSLKDEDRVRGLESVYAATSIDDLVHFTAKEKELLFHAMIEVIPEFRSKVRIFSPRTSLYALLRQHGDPNSKPYPCKGGIDFFSSAPGMETPIPAATGEKKI